MPLTVSGYIRLSISSLTTPIDRTCCQPLRGVGLSQAARVKCEVSANIKTARGKRHGHATLVLGPRSAGAEAKKSYSLRVKAAGGMAQVERDCTAF